MCVFTVTSIRRFDLHSDASRKRRCCAVSPKSWRVDAAGVRGACSSSCAADNNAWNIAFPRRKRTTCVLLLDAIRSIAQCSEFQQNYCYRGVCEIRKDVQSSKNSVPEFELAAWVGCVCGYHTSQLEKPSRGLHKHSCAARWRVHTAVAVGSASSELWLHRHLRKMNFEFFSIPSFLYAALNCMHREEHSTRLFVANDVHTRAESQD